MALVVGFIMFSVSGASGNGGGVIWLVPGLIALIVGIILVSPFFLALLARIGAKSPIAIRLPLRDMARYRARSGSALSAISLGIMIAGRVKDLFRVISQRWHRAAVACRHESLFETAFSAASRAVSMLYRRTTATVLCVWPRLRLD